MQFFIVDGHSTPPSSAYSGSLAIDRCGQPQVLLHEIAKTVSGIGGSDFMLYQLGYSDDKHCGSRLAARHVRGMGTKKEIRCP